MNDFDNYKEILISEFPKCCAICEHILFTDYMLTCKLDWLKIDVNGVCDKFELSDYYKDKNEMSYVLVKFEADWADEFYIEGFAIYDKDMWEKIVEDFKNAKSYTGFYFGTNEGFESEEITKNWLSNYKVTNITQQDWEIFKKYFSPYGKSICFGKFKCPSELIDE